MSTARNTRHNNNNSNNVKVATVTTNIETVPGNVNNPSLTDIYNLISKVDDTVSNLSTKFDALDYRTTNLEIENAALKEKVTILHNRLSITEYNIYQLQQKQFENYITISNLPFEENENLIDSVIAAIRLLHIDVDKENIVFCKRIGGHNNQFVPLVIVEFENNNLKETVLDIAKRSGPILPSQLRITGKGPAVPTQTSDSGDKLYKILFGQYQTNYTRQLLKEARKLRLKHGIDFIWQDRGTILIKFNKDSKKTYRIKTFEDLHKFITLNLQNSK